MAIVTIVIIITISMKLQYCNTNNIDNIEMVTIFKILIILQLQASSNINDLTLLTIFKIYISNNIDNMAMLGQKI